MVSYWGVTLESQLRIYFGSSLANLYAVGYLSSDIHKLIALSEALGREEDAPNGREVENWFNYTNRYTRALERHAQNSRITSARNGSLELLLGGMGVAASIIVPIAIAKAQEKLQKKANLQKEGQKLQFEVSPTDKVLKRHIELYARGEYGVGVEGLNNLLGTLSALRYNVSAISDNTYQISRAIDVCARRIVKIVRYVASS